MKVAWLARDASEERGIARSCNGSQGFGPVYKVRRTGMLKVHILSRRRADMTHEQYVTRWREVHAPLFASQPDVKRYVRKYVQCWVTRDKPAGPNLGDTDGIVELWFDDIAGFNAFANSPSYLNVIRVDEERFTDPKKCEYFFSEEHSIIA